MMFAGKKQHAQSRSESAGNSKTGRWVSTQREAVKKDRIDEQDRRKRELEKGTETTELSSLPPIMSLRHMSRTILRGLQGPREQNPRGLIKQSHGKSMPDSDKASVGRAIIEPVKQVCVNEKGRIKEADKAETLMQIICWGPH